MNLLKVWSAIGLLVMASSAGDVLLSAAMKRIGDLDALRALTSHRPSQPAPAPDRN